MVNKLDGPKVTRLRSPSRLAFRLLLLPRFALLISSALAPQDMRLDAERKADCLAQRVEQSFFSCPDGFPENSERLTLRLRLRLSKMIQVLHQTLSSKTPIDQSTPSSSRKHGNVNATPPHPPAASPPPSPPLPPLHPSPAEGWPTPVRYCAPKSARLALIWPVEHSRPHLLRSGSYADRRCVQNVQSVESGEGWDEWTKGAFSAPHASREKDHYVRRWGRRGRAGFVLVVLVAAWPLFTGCFRERVKERLRERACAAVLTEVR
ncbi:hypothetical protein EJ06DRAFT_92782 [Trichodelitschia bisporula]|uniref:Uncharacterized protein n=1 Tax=Trichodelitschia bisporula TaxID=703511 RepID=A0A6G1HSE2_9PEZI|nr:hypothetical protein EJ06DRAFT_92782 [Trichodelitschia bisporula]